MAAERRTFPGGFAEAAARFSNTMSGTDMGQQMAAAQEAMTRNFEAANSELVSFWQERLASACALPARLAQCKTPMEALEVQAEYGREFLSAYTEAWTRLTALVTSATPQRGVAPAPAAERKRREP
jgi:hypothetical protein